MNQKPTKHKELILCLFYSWVRDLPWSVADILSDTPFNRTDIPFASRCQMQMAYLFYWKNALQRPRMINLTFYLFSTI